jgi:hypothetical protein
MDSDGVALNDKCHAQHGSGGASDAKDDTCSPAWLHLKTITTFDSGMTCQTWTVLEDFLFAYYSML